MQFLKRKKECLYKEFKIVFCPFQRGDADMGYRARSLFGLEAGECSFV